MSLPLPAATVSLAPIKMVSLPLPATRTLFAPKVSVSLPLPITTALFGASLTGLISHPVRYGWNWDVIIQAQGGYGSFNPAIVNRVMHGQPAVKSWSEFAFTQLSLDDHI